MGVHPIYADFTAGEITDRAAGRVETTVYHRACRIIENFIPKVQGGVERRRGTILVAAVDDHDKKSRLISWEEPDNLYYLELCVGKIKIYKESTAALVHTISTGVPWATAELEDIWVAFDGAYTMIFTYGNWKTARLVHDSPYGDTDWTLDQPTMTVTGYSGAPITMDWIESANGCDLVTSVTGVGEVSYGEKAHDGNDDTYSSALPIDFGVGEGIWTFTFVEAKSIDEFKFKVKGYVLGLIAYSKIKFEYYDGTWHTLEEDVQLAETAAWYTYSAGYENVTKVRVTGGCFLDHASSTRTSGSLLYTASAKEDIEATLFNSAGHYAAVCRFIQTRLALANTRVQPNRIFFSLSIDQTTGEPAYTDFTLNTGTEDKASNGFSVAAYANRGGQIRWMVGEDVLIAGTSGGEITISGGDGGLSATALSIIKNPTHYGGSNKAIAAGDAVLFVQKGNTKLREMVLGDNLKYAANDLMTLAEEVAKPGINALEISTVPDTLIFAQRVDGELAVMNYERALQVLAWHRFITDGLFESIAVGTDSNQVDKWWVIVNRTINGYTKRYIERFAPAWEELKDAIYVDSAVTFDNGDPLDIEDLDVIDPVTITITGHGLSGGEKILIEDVLGTTELNGNVYTVEYIGANSFSLRDEGDDNDIDGTQFKLTLDVDPTPGDFEPAATLTGTPSAKTATVISKIDSKTYYCAGDGFDPGDSISDGTNTAACTSPYPKSGFFLSAYISAGTVTKVQKDLTGLTHLALKELQILGDGAVIAPETVDVSGNLTMANYANLIHVGLKFISKLMPMPLEAGAREGTAQGRTKRIDRIVIRFKDSLGCKVGQNEDELELLRFRKTNALMGVPTQPLSGDIESSFPGGYDTTGDILIVQDEPLPLSIVALMPRLQTNE